MQLAGGIMLSLLVLGACTTGDNLALLDDAAAMHDAPAPVDAAPAADTASSPDAALSDAADCLPWPDPFDARLREALDDLHTVEHVLLERYAADGRYPDGSTGGTTPGTACCAQAGMTCALLDEDWIAWTGFGLAVPASRYFQWNYVSDGAGASVRATGDLDCNAITFDLELTCTSAGGEPVCVLHLPPCAE
jgi:hypothetical protein